MFSIIILLVSFVISDGTKYAKPSKNKQSLTFPEKYYVKGTLHLPYAQIEEPFDAWYDGPNKRSRIDYYGGEYRGSLKSKHVLFR